MPSMKGFGPDTLLLCMTLTYIFFLYHMPGAHSFSRKIIVSGSCRGLIIEKVEMKHVVRKVIEIARLCCGELLQCTEKWNI